MGKSQVRKTLDGSGLQARRRRLGIVLWLIPVGFFVLAEGISRWWVSPTKMVYAREFEYDPDKSYRLKANFRWVEPGHVPVITNSMGHRDDEIPEAKPSGTKRVLLLGDSITYGHGVVRRATFGELLEQRLSVHYPRWKFDVINTGVPGYSAVQSLHDLKRGLSLSPDLIVTQFVLNDLVEPYRVLTRYGGSGQDYHGVQDMLPLVHWLRENSALFGMMELGFERVRPWLVDLEAEKIRARKRQQQLSWDLGLEAPQTQLQQEVWHSYLEALGEQFKLARTQSIPIVFLISPVWAQHHHFPEKNYARLRLLRFAKDHRVPVLDLLPRFQGESLKWNEFFLDNMHYSENGHRWVAHHLGKLIEQKLSLDQATRLTAGE